MLTSDRNGSPHIYTMNKNGGNLSRISFGYCTYSDPTWSTQGNLIACKKSLKKRFCLITLINPDSKQEQTIAQTPAINGYSWSPKGRCIIFSKEEKTDRYQQHNPYTLYKIDM